jgi:hypothetical protein
MQATNREHERSHLCSLSSNLTSRQVFHQSPAMTLATSGSMVSSTVLTLLVIPAVYLVWRGWSLAGRKDES